MTKTLGVGALFASVYLMTTVAAQQGVQQESHLTSTTAARVGGTVLAETGQPLGGALVKADCEANREESVTTVSNAAGQWQLVVPSGRCRVRITKSGYIPGWYSPPRWAPNGWLNLAQGQTVIYDLRLARGATISGRIRNDAGTPMSGARVYASAYQYFNWTRRLFPVGASATTDEDGRYRLDGLPPGDYVISAVMSSTVVGGRVSSPQTFSPTYFPGTPAAEGGSLLTVSAGSELEDISFPVVSARLATVSGTAVHASGKPITRGMVRLVATGPTAPLVGHAVDLMGNNSFVFSNVPPGEYKLDVVSAPFLNNGTRAGGPTDLEVDEAGSMALRVSGIDIDDIAIVTNPTGAVFGRVVFEDSTPFEAGPAGMTVQGYTLSVASMRMGAIGAVNDDWTFRVAGLHDRHRFRVAGVPKGWFLKAVMLRGIDVSERGIEFQKGERVDGLEMVLTRRMARVRGVVKNAAGWGVPHVPVVIFSGDSDKWGYQTRFVRRTTTDEDGSFTFEGMPPDDYLVLAATSDAGSENDPEQLEKWRKVAVPIALSERELKSVTIPLQR